MRQLDRGGFRSGVLAPAALVLVGLLAGCDTYAPVEFDSQIAVEAYLEAHAPLRQVRVGRTSAIGGGYDFDRSAVRNASVQVHLLGMDGEPERTYQYFEDSDRPGIYVTNAPDNVRAGRTYRLEVVVPGEVDTISSTTTVPESLIRRSVSADTLVYQGSEQLEVEISRSETGARQRVFVFSTEALEPTEENLTPFAKAIYDPEEITLHDLSRGSSPLLNEANYDILDANTIRIQLPWIAVLFYGPNVLSISAVDDNYYDFRRSADIQQGGSTLGPGEMPNVIDHVEGGTGIFGSFARINTILYVAKAGEL